MNDDDTNEFVEKFEPVSYVDESEIKVNELLVGSLDVLFCMPSY